MPIKTILAAVAQETEDDPVIGRAIQLAAQHNAQLILVHVIEYPEQGDQEPDLPISQDTLTAILEADVTDRLNRLSQKTADPVEIIVETGKPHVVIEAIARRHKADLVVIGTGNPKNIRERAFGSTADRVLRSSHCPVLVVKRPATDRYQYAAVAVDFSALSSAAIDAAARIAQAARLDMIHAVEIPLAFEQAMLKAGTPKKDIDQYRKAKSHTARKALKAMLEKENGVGKNTTMRIIHGPAGEAILRLAKNRKIELLSLGTQGRNAVSQFVLGSVARKVLAASPCDVLIVPTTAL